MHVMHNSTSQSMALAAIDGNDASERRDQTVSSEQSANQSVQKAAVVLDALLDGRPMRVSDVVRSSGLGQSTVSRMLATLESIGYIERDDLSGMYQFGSALITVGGVALNQNPIHHASRQTAQELASKTGLGVNVAVRQAASLFYLCNFEGAQAPRPFTLIGQRNPLHATALGKCLLLELGEGKHQELHNSLTRYTPHTITNGADLDKTLEAVQRNGYATEKEELALGRACVAAPITSRDGRVVAGISLSGSLTAMNLDEYESDLARTAIEAADLISSKLGYHGPYPLHSSMQTTESLRYVEASNPSLTT